jgi:hypothetical protein
VLLICTLKEERQTVILRKIGFLVAFCLVLFLQNAAHTNAQDFNFKIYEGFSRLTLIKVKEKIGLVRDKEPVELWVKSSGAKSDGSDIRVYSSSGVEIPYQIISHDNNNSSFLITFFVDSLPYESKIFYVLHGNLALESPNYEKQSYFLDNNSQVWQTEGIYLKWGGKAGYFRYVDEPITELRFSKNGNFSRGVDVLTDDQNAWDPDKSYGYLGSNISGANPKGFGSRAGFVSANGPIFIELALGTARIRYYKNHNSWILTNGVVDSAFFFSKFYDREKHDENREIIINNNGPWDVGPWRTFYESYNENPKYMAFRQSSTGLIFGAVSINTFKWYISGKESGGWDRVISFDDSSNREDAKIYWYSDMSNSYEGIENFAKRVLNPLEVEIIKQDIPLDTTPPNTAFTINPETPDGNNGWYLTNPWVSLTPDETATTFYWLNDQDETTYTLPIYIPEGVNTLSFYSIDEASNKEAIKTLEFKVDKSPPEIEVTINPYRSDDRFFVGELIEVNYRASDLLSGISTVSTSFNGKPFYMGEPLLLDSPGRKELIIRAEDKAGNVNIYRKVFYVDEIVSVKWWPPIGRSQNSRVVFKLGRTLPLKFSLLSHFGSLIQTNSVKVVILGEGGSVELGVGSGSAALRYDEEEGFYIVNFHTSKYSWVKPGEYQVFVYYASSGNQTASLVGMTSFQLIDRKKK